MCVVLVPSIGLRTTISNTTQIRPQYFRNVMRVHWECAWCQCQILVLEPPYPTLHKYIHSNSETSCVSIGKVRGASAKYWFQHQNIQHYTNMPTALQKLHVCPLRMCVVLVPNIGLRTTISNTSQIRPQHFRNFMRVHWECAWCQYQILVLEPPHPKLHKYTHRNSETSCVSTGNAHGASAKFWFQNHHIQHYTKTLTALQKLHACALGMCMVLVTNFGLRTTISNTTQIHPQQFRNFMCVHWKCAWCQCQILVLAPEYSTLHKYAHSTSETSCMSTENVRGASAKYWSQTTISNTSQIRPQHFRNFLCVHWECAWCQCQILVLEPPHPKLHKYTHRNSETSCVSTGNAHGASAKFWFLNHHIQQYTKTLTALQKLHACALGMCMVLVTNFGLRTTISNTTQIHTQQFRNFMCVHWKCAWCQCQILVLAPEYSTLHKYAHSTLETSCVCTGNVHGASAKFWSQNHHIQNYTNTPTDIQKLHVCPLEMRMVLVPNIVF